MSGQIQGSRPAQSLRTRAEEQLGKTREAVKAMPAEEAQELVYELQVHQIELEMQNEELRQTQLELETSRDAYLDLYDFAPVGYLTLDRQGVILEANLTAATLLGIAREELLRKKLAHFTVPADQDTLHRHCWQVLSTGGKQTCEIRIRTAEGAVLCVRLETVAVEDDKAQRNMCHMTLADVTKRKQVEEELERHRNHLEELVQQRTARLNAINKPLRCENDEEVARTCLAVAEELTASKFGFICEVNQAGRFDTLAISNPGWNACRIPKTDAVLMLDNLEIRRMRGEVVKDGRPLLCNDPASHPAWAGTPEGHPAITSYLGVPLKHAGKTIGTIGLANKESYYDLADQKVVEAIAASFVEALQRQRAEAELERQRGFQEAILDCVADGIVACDRDGTLIHFNRAMHELHGWPKKPILLEDWAGLDTIYEGDGKTPLRKERMPLLRTLKGEDVCNQELVIAPQGVPARTLLATGRMLKDSRGNTLGAVVSMHDVTERKRSQETLKERTKELSCLYGIAKLVEREGCPLDEICQEAANILSPSLQHPEIACVKITLGDSEFATANFTHGNWRLSADIRGPGTVAGKVEVGYLEERAELYEGPFSREERLLIDAAAKHLGRILDRRRMTKALEKSESRLREAQKMAQVGHWEWDVKTGDVEWSEEVFRIFGLDPAAFTPHIDSILALSPWPEDHARDKDLIRRAVESHEKGDYEQRFLRSDQSIGYYYSTFQGIYDAKGNLISLIGTIQDITERKKVAKTLERLNAGLDRKNRELESVLYVASHDLWSPLVNIKGFSNELSQACKALPSLVADAQLPSDLKEQLSTILKHVVPRAIEYIAASVSKMDKLLTGMLRLSRLGQAALQLEQLDMNAMLSDIAKSIEFQVRNAGARLQIDNLPPCVGDATQVNQVFSNLLDNAVKYLDPARPGVIRVYGHQGKGWATYCVKDNGIGIAPEDTDRVFRAFHRLQPQGPVTGEGLGLATVHRILDGHEGNIWVKSAPGEGSRFFVSLACQADLAKGAAPTLLDVPATGLSLPVFDTKLTAPGRAQRVCSLPSDTLKADSTSNQGPGFCSSP